MTKQVPAAGPDATLLAGSGFVPTLRRWFLASRPPFLTASVLPVLVGVAWGFSASGNFDIMASLLALLATMFVHAASNVYNDVGDDYNGTDRINQDRLYPFTGGTQFIQRGVMTRAEMKRLAAGQFSIAVVFGLWLVALKGWPVLVFGLLGIAAGLLYSMPGVMLSGKGIGEAIIGIAFGMLPVVGAAWLQSGVIDGSAILVSVPVSVWVSAILLINEVPDRAADEQVGKRTLPVRFGVPVTRYIYLVLHAGGAAAIVAMIVRGELPAVAVIMPLVLLPMAFVAASRISLAKENIPALLPGVKATLTIHALGSIGLTAAILFSG